MNDRTRVVQLRWPIAIAAALALVALGVGVSYIVRAPREDVSQEPAAAPARLPSSDAVGTADVSAPATVTLSPELAARAGIQVASVVTTSASDALRVPAVVEPHGYRQVTVTPLAAGRITRVAVQLGDQVSRGQTLADVYSPELATAQTAYLSARASLEAARQRLQRTDRLVEIGAASRQEYEEVRAEESRLASEVEGARSTLVLLGMTPATVQQLSTAGQMTSTISVPAPIAGVVTARGANVGLNVDPGTPLFTVVDLSTVWVVGSVYERDFGKVRVGTAATVTADAFADLALAGRVSYIDPQVDEATRTAKVRVEIANRDRLLRLGMYVSLTLDVAASRSVMIVPAAAVQTLGERTVVYLVDPQQKGRFIERQITIGDRVNDQVQVLTGLSPADVVVTQGAFFLRAERERVNPSAAQPGAASRPGVTVQVTERGFEPDRVTVARGEQALVTFIRRTENTCAKEVVVEAQGIRRELPLNQPVTIEIKASSGGDIAFACGMNMLKGVVVVP